MPIYLDKVLGSLKENLGLGHYKHWQKKRHLKAFVNGWTMHWYKDYEGIYYRSLQNSLIW